MDETLKIWHRFVADENPALLAEILHDDVSFHSPFVWKSKDGKPIVTAVLSAAVKVFTDFRYVREITDETNAMLEFEAKVGDLTVRGVDIIKTDAEGKIIDLEVMVRPANGLQALGEEMTRLLSGG